MAAEPSPSDGRWQMGIEYEAPKYNSGGSIDPCGDVGEGTKSTTAGEANVQWDPYILWTEDQCSAVSLDHEAMLRGITQDLETQTSHKIESILWSNTVDGADFGGSHPNISLSDASVPVNAGATNPGPGFIWIPNAYDTFPITTAFKDMIEALSDAMGGARGMIHVEKRILPFLSFFGLAIQNGQRLVTTLGDHIVVPGTGYTGTDPAGNASGENHTWIYGTSMVEVLISPIDTFADKAGSITKTSNLVEYRAERMALAHWDKQVHIGIPVCLEDPQGDCSDSGS